MGRKRKTQYEFFKKGGDFLKSNKKVVIGILLFLAIFAVGIIWFGDFLQTSPYFDCAVIEIVKEGKSGKFEAKKDFFRLNPALNIFMANHLVLAKTIKDAHPEFQDVEIIKFLPDRIIAKIRDRRAVAKIKLGKIYLVDCEGVVLSQSADEIGIKQLPFIIGLESQLFNPRQGRVLKSNRLLRALNLQTLISRRNELKGFPLSVIDISYPEKTNFTLDGITIIIGDNEFERKLDLLVQILRDPKIDKAALNSIDLRFTDVILDTKLEKEKKR